jgi:heat shock protein HslJ
LILPKKKYLSSPDRIKETYKISRELKFHPPRLNMEIQYRGENMKSARQFLLPVLLVTFSFLIYSCQSGNRSESEPTDLPIEENTTEQEQDSMEIQIVTVDKIINITWQWFELTENNSAAQSVVPDPGNYTLVFWDDGTFGFKADCNSGSGSYTVEGNRIEFGPMMTTLAMCPPESLYDQYLARLGDVEGFGMTAGKLVLSLKEDAGEMYFANGGLAEKPMEPEIAPIEKTLYVGPEKVDCVGVGPMECFQVKENPDGEWQNFYDQIEGFDWEPGYTYEIRVAVHQVENPPADGSSLRYELIEVVDKVETPSESEKAKQYIEIILPTEGATLAAGKPIQVSGMGAGLFEGNVVVQALDADGNELALAPTIIDSPEAGIGGEGPWKIELDITVDTATPGKIVAFSPSPKDGEGWLASDEVTVTFDPSVVSEPTLENTTWQLTGLTDGKLNPLLAVHLVTATFDPVEGRISGTGGCNRYFGEYQIDGGKLSIPGPLGSTRMMCPEPQMQVETAYLTALEQVVHYELKCGTLSMFDAQGEAILTYQVDPYSQTESFTREELANMSYLSEWTDSGTVQLVNGEYRTPAAEGSATELVVMLTNYAAFGDLDGDGQDEAVVILVTNPGGSGTFYNLAVVRKQGEALSNLATTLLGDRVQIKSIRIENGEAMVDMLTHGPDDGMCCPTQYTVNRYVLQNGELILINSETIE